MWGERGRRRRGSRGLWKFGGAGGWLPSLRWCPHWCAGSKASGLGLVLPSQSRAEGAVGEGPQRWRLWVRDGLTGGAREPAVAMVASQQVRWCDGGGMALSLV